MTESILAIEASSETCSVALLHEGQVLSDSSDIPRGHAANILPMIDALLKQQSLVVSDLDALAVTNGPGAFTSVRIGTAVCQGLAVASNRPVIAASSLEVLALGAMQKSTCQSAMVALDARMNEVYFGFYDISDSDMIKARQPDQVAAPAEIMLAGATSNTACVAAGMGWIAYHELMKERFSGVEYTQISMDFPSAEVLVELAAHRWRQGDFHDVRTLTPVYLRDNVVNS